MLMNLNPNLLLHKICHQCLRGDCLLACFIKSSMISIHAAHARGNTSLFLRSCSPPDFNPRPSCEGRRQKTDKAVTQLQFQSTPLMRGATLIRPRLSSMNIFQSTPLMRGATQSITGFPPLTIISIHAPHARGD